MVIFSVHEASPTSFRQPRIVYRPGGEKSHLMRSIRPLPACRRLGRSLFLPFLLGSDQVEMTSGFYGMQAIHTTAHLLQAIYEGVVFSHMTHLNRMRERFTDVTPYASLAARRTPMSGCKCWRT
ncbi:hypothetical protein ACLK1T_13340 [Escherichia coli]